MYVGSVYDMLKPLTGPSDDRSVTILWIDDNLNSAESMS